MANDFKNFTATASTTGADLYTVNSSVTAIVTSLIVTNYSGGATTVTIKHYDANRSTAVSIVEAVSVPANSTLLPIESQKLVLMGGDKITIQSGANSAINVNLSVSEFS